MKQFMPFSVVVVISAAIGIPVNSGCSTPAANNGDAQVLDARPDHRDADAGCGSGLMCEECNVSGYMPIMQNKPVQVLNACSAPELQAFVTACFSAGATMGTCTAWEAMDGGACRMCLAPVLRTSPTWGPFDCANAQAPCGANAGGCVDLILNTVSQEMSQGGTGSCGDLVTINFGCQDYACSECDAPNDNDAGDGVACESSAVANECLSFVDAVDSTTGVCGIIGSDAAPAAITDCFPQTDAENVNFVNVFCGTGT